MTGEIIYFQGHLDLKRGQLYREQTVSRHAILAPAIPARSRAGGEAGRRILPMLPGSERRAAGAGVAARAGAKATVSGEP